MLKISCFRLRQLFSFLFAIWTLLLFTACFGGEKTADLIDYLTPPLQQSEKISIVITASRTSCIAPCGIMFDATETTSDDFSEPFHQLHYTWNYGDQNSSFEQRPDVDANTSSSPIGAHVFEYAGSYIVELEVIDSNGEFASEAVTIEVKDPDIAYAENTYCVSNTGSFANCPSLEPSFHISSYQSATELLLSITNQIDTLLPTRILFRSGEVFTASAVTRLKKINSPVLISSYGSGEMPVVKIDPSMTDNTLFFFENVQGLTISGINFVGNYIPATGLGNHPNALFFHEGCSNNTLYKNQFSGLGLNLYLHGGLSAKTGWESKYQMAVDNKISDWQDIGVFGNIGAVSAILSNSIKQSDSAVSGSDAKCGDCIPNYPDHGGIRVEKADRLLVQYNTIFNNAGWSSAGMAHQPNIRLGTNGLVNKSVVSDNLLEGGFALLEMIPASNSAASSAVKGNVIIEKNKFLATSNTEHLLDIVLGGVIIRNNLFLKPNNGAPLIGSGSFNAAIRFRVLNTTPGNLELNNIIINNTLISLSENDANNLKLVEVNNSFTSFSIFNNLVYIPFAKDEKDAGLLSWKSDQLLSDVLSDNNLVFAPLTSNYFWNNGQTNDLNQWKETGNDLNSILGDPNFESLREMNGKLLFGSPAIDSGSPDRSVIVDYFNDFRLGDVDIGAVEF